MRIECVLLDIDGTLIDSNAAHAAAWVDVLRENDRPADYYRLRRMIGMGGDKILPIATGLDPESKEGKAILDRRTQIFLDRYLPRLSAFRGTRTLLRHMRTQGLRLVIATSAGKEELPALLEVAGAEPFLFQATSSDDADSSKPDPDIVRAALRKGATDPARAVMIGDTPYDIEAARRAGVPSIGFRSGGWSSEALRGAREIYGGPEDLVARYRRSMLWHG